MNLLISVRLPFGCLLSLVLLIHSIRLNIPDYCRKQGIKSLHAFSERLSSSDNPSHRLPRSLSTVIN